MSQCLRAGWNLQKFSTKNRSHQRWVNPKIFQFSESKNSIYIIFQKLSFWMLNRIDEPNFQMMNRIFEGWTEFSEDEPNFRMTNRIFGWPQPYIVGQIREIEFPNGPNSGEHSIHPLQRFHSINFHSQRVGVFPNFHFQHSYVGESEKGTWHCRR